MTNETVVQSNGITAAYTIDRRGDWHLIARSDLTAMLQATEIRRGDIAVDPRLAGTVTSVMRIDDWIRIETDGTCNNVMYFHPYEGVKIA